jgi:hypothetical protein
MNWGIRRTAFWSLVLVAISGCANEGRTGRVSANLLESQDARGNVCPNPEIGRIDLVASKSTLALGEQVSIAASVFSKSGVLMNGCQVSFSVSNTTALLLTVTGSLSAEVQAQALGSGVIQASKAGVKGYIQIQVVQSPAPTTTTTGPLPAPTTSTTTTVPPAPTTTSTTSTTLPPVSGNSILAPDRKIDWSQAGVKNGIPHRTTICATFSQGASVSQINDAIASCPANQVIYLNAGTYQLAGGIDFGGRSNVTLRGAGADQTHLIFSDDTPCLGMYANICLRGSDLGYYGPSPARVADWTSGYSKGTSSITLSSTTGLSAGMRLVLDQLDDAADTGDIFVCATGGVCTEQGGGSNGRPRRGQRQIVTVTQISGSTVTFDPPLYMPNWRSSQSPGAYWGGSGSLAGFIGIEDLSIDGTNGKAGQALVTMLFTHDSWVKGVRGINCPTPRACVLIYQSDHNTVRDSYFYGSTNYSVGSTTYGVETFGSCDARVENNVIHHRTSPFVSDGDCGSVFAYNYVFDDYYPISPNWMQASQYSHEIGNAMILHEGNEGVGIKGDIIHGTSNLFTHFRNYMHGYEPGKTAETNPVNLYAYNRYWNFVGNVFGELGFHATYEGSGNSIYRFGRGYNTIPADPIAAGTILRWGNYDTVAGTRFVASEVPSNLAKYPNPVPASQALPASFYLSAKPQWFGSAPWPAIGPDVAGGVGPGGHVQKIPSRLCYEGAQKDSGGIMSFNATRCYGASETRK